MAAPTNVRVESNSISTATLRWSYAGTAVIGVYRSTDGISYSEITDSETRIAVGTLLYISTGLAVGTKYYYKLSDDLGSTFSSVVTVHTQACLPPAGSLDTFSLPRLEPPNDARIAPDDPNAQEILVVDTFNDLSERIENVLGGRVLAPDECIACPSDGAVILNCAGHCRQWVVIADEDINSISLQYCDEGEGNIDFVIPPNVTRRITGYPDGFGFSGDEPSVVSGSAGRTVSVPISPTGGKANPVSSRPGTGSGIGSGGGVGAGSCNCTAVNGALTIKSCNANNSLNCTTTKALQLIACGGRGPYTWTRTGTVSIRGSNGPAGSTAGGSVISVTPPTNTAPATAGVAYSLFSHFMNSAGGSCENHIAIQEFSCNDVGGSCSTGADPTGLPATCGNGDITTLSQLPCKSCSDTSNPCTGGGGGQCFGGPPGFGCNTSACSALTPGGKMCDKRTAPMIAAGCIPCGLSSGDTVTVTDAVGTQTTVILKS